MAKILRARFGVLVLILLVCAPLQYVKAIPTFYGGGLETPGTWSRILQTNVSLFVSSGDFYHYPWEADHIQQLVDHGVKVNFRIDWWARFWNGERAWNTSVVDLFYNTTLMEMLEEEFDWTFRQLEMEHIWAVTLSEEGPRASYRYFRTPESWARYNETYHSETGYWLRNEYDMNKTEEAILNAWLSEKNTWVFNHLYDYVKARWPHLNVFQFQNVYPGAPPVWVDGSDVTGLKADGHVGDLYYYDVYLNPFWMYDFVRHFKTTYPEVEYHFWIWGEEPWPEDGLAGGFEHIRRNAWIAYLAGVDALGWFNWHYDHGWMWEREDSYGKRLLAYTNRINEEFAKLPVFQPRPQILVVKDQPMSFQVGVCSELGLFYEWDSVNQRTLAHGDLDLSQYRMVVCSEDVYLDEVVDMLNSYVRSGGNLLLLGGFGWEQKNFYYNDTRKSNFLIEEGISQKHVWGDILFNISEPNPLGLNLTYEHLGSSLLALPREELTVHHQPIGEFFNISEDDGLTRLEYCPLVLYRNSSDPQEGSILYWGVPKSTSNPEADYRDVVESFLPEWNYTRHLYRVVGRGYAQNFLGLTGIVTEERTENLFISQSQIDEGFILAGICNFYPQTAEINYILDLNRFNLSAGRYWVHSLDENRTWGWFESKQNLLEVPIHISSNGVRLLLVSQQKPEPSYWVEVFPEIPSVEEVKELWLPMLTIFSDNGDVFGEGAYEKGGKARFSVSPETVIGQGVRHTFVGWNSSSPGGYNGPENPAEVVMNDDVSEVAMWATQYFLDINAESGGSVNPSSGWYDEGSEVTITATPKTGFSFSSWIGNGPGSFSGTNSEEKITINGPINQTAIFLDVAEPVADAGANRRAKVGENVIFDATRSSDNAGIVSFEWDLGDGSKVFGPIATHSYSKPGTITVILTVKDAAGNSDSAVIKVAVGEEVSEPGKEGWSFPPWILFLVVIAVIMGIVPFLLIMGTSRTKRRRT